MLDPMSEQIGEKWQRLARLVTHRRVRLGHASQTEFASASGLKIRTLNNIENARRPGYDPSTIALLEQGLQWQPGSVEAILAGGDPTPAPAAAADVPPDVDQLKEARRVLIDALTLTDPRAMREAMVDAAGLVARAIERERFHETG
jgi:transcriptional regulator with XRE-family HTH domain